MEIDLLKSDEIEVECQVRSISTESVEAIESLKSSLAAEREGSQEAPKKMHPRARQKPDAEIATCQAKLQQHQKEFLQIGSLQSSEQCSVARGLHARLLHVQGRLQRATSSPTYGTKAQETLDSCQGLLDALKQYLSDPSLLKQSLDSAKLVNVDMGLGDGGSKGMDPGAGDFSEEKRDNLVISTPKSLSAENGSGVGDQTELIRTLMAQVQLMSNQLQALQNHPPAPPAVVTGPLGNPTKQEQKVVNPSALPSAIGHHNVLKVGRASSPNQPMAGGIQPVQDHSPYVHGNSVFDRRSLARCGISYNGSPTGITVDMFLFQLDSVVASIRVSPEVLLLDLHLLLRDVALQWYWTYRRHNPLASWPELRGEFLERFKDRRTPYEIRRMVESRRQLPHESFLDFYHHMWSLSLQCHTPYRDEEFIQLLLNNMKPALQYHLTDRHFSHINDLIKSCTAWEETLKRFRSPPDPATFPRRVVGELLADWYDESGLPILSGSAAPTELSADCSLAAYRDSSLNPVAAAKPLNQLPLGNPQFKPLRTEVPGNCPVCFNCSDIGHTFQDCPLPPTGYFCYRCGRKNTIASKCPRCAGNRNSGQWRSGSQGPPKITTPTSVREDAASNTDPELRWRSAPGGKDQTSP